MVCVPDRVNGYEADMVTYGAVSGMMGSSMCLAGVVGPLMASFLTEVLTFNWSTTIMAFIIMVMVSLEHMLS